jgi:hypothetical protein
MNAAFRGSIEVPNTNRPLPCKPTISEAKPKLLDVVPKSDEQWDVTDIKGMSADNIRWLLQQLSEVDKPPTPTFSVQFGLGSGGKINPRPNTD